MNTRGVHTYSQALLHKPPLSTHKKNWGQDGELENATLGSAGLKKSGHPSRQGMKIQPDSFFTWNKNCKAFGERTKILSPQWQRLKTNYGCEGKKGKKPSTYAGRIEKPSHCRDHQRSLNIGGGARPLRNEELPLHAGTEGLLEAGPG